MPWLKLGEFYERHGDKQEATRCYAQAVGKWQDRMSEHAKRASRVYQTRSVVPDDIVPNGFLHYCGPAVEISAVCQRLATLYGEAGNDALASYYRELGARLAP